MSVRRRKKDQFPTDDLPEYYQYPLNSNEDIIYTTSLDFEEFLRSPNRHMMFGYYANFLRHTDARYRSAVMTLQCPDGRDERMALLLSAIADEMTGRGFGTDLQITGLTEITVRSRI